MKTEELIKLLRDPMGEDVPVWQLAVADELEKLRAQAARYEALRKLTPVQIEELHRRNTYCGRELRCDGG